MAPVDPAIHSSNVVPVLYFWTHLVAIGGCIGVISNTLQRAQRTLPAAQNTRNHQRRRNTDLRTLLVIATVSFALCAYYTVARHVLSYETWTYRTGGRLDTPNALPGWKYTRTHDTAGVLTGDAPLNLGLWWENTSLLRDGWHVLVVRARRFWWTQQWMSATLIWTTFMGIESRRRNLPPLTIFAFLCLPQLVGLTFAQSLFYMAIELTPMPLGEPAGLTLAKLWRRLRHGDVKLDKLVKEKNSPLWTRRPAFYLVPGLIGLYLVSALPSRAYESSLVPVMAVISLAVPLGLAATLNLAPKSWGTTHPDIHTAHRSHTLVFSVLSIAALLLHLSASVAALRDNMPPAPPSNPSWAQRTLQHLPGGRSPTEQEVLTTAHRLRFSLWAVLSALGDHPAVNAVGWDVLLSALTLALWAARRKVDVEGVLKCSLAPTLVVHRDSEMKAPYGVLDEPKSHGRRKSVSFAKGDVSPPTSPTGTTRKASTAKGRGKKADPEPASPTVAETKGKGSTARRRRSTKAAKEEEDAAQHDVTDEPEVDTEFTPTPALKKSIPLEHEEHPLSASMDVVHEAEVSGLAWGLFVLGGLGTASGGVLGSEVRLG